MVANQELETLIKILILCLLLLQCRHTELFRSCKRDSDKSAKNYMLEWTKGYIQIPNSDIKIPIMDIKKCLPETWKVCTLFLAVVSLDFCFCLV